MSARDPRDDFATAVVIGLGLIGGSLARDLAARGVRVIGFDRDVATARAARDAGVVEHAHNSDASLESIPEDSLVIFAVPVDAATALLERAAPHLLRARLITDVGSTKQSIVDAADALGLGDRFVGSHPLAGDHRAGWHASRTGLFADAPVFLCPARTASDDAIERARALWSSLGARPVLSDAASHDRLLAWTSHLPQLTATALALALDDAGVAHDQLGPGGRDATRIAASSPDMWTAIARDNATHLADAIVALERQLGALRASIERDDADALRHLLARAADWRGA